jgi:uncharacterized protein (TIGR03083 family)
MYILFMDHWKEIELERRSLTDQLATLSDQQWNTPSLCGEWTVREVAAHLVVPHKTSLFGFAREMLKSGGNFDRASIKLTSREAQRSNAELVEDLRKFTEGRFTPPGFGSEAPLADVMIHGQDIRIPLGLTTPGPLEHWTHVLDLLVSKKARKAFVPGAIPDVQLVASDLDWSHGAGSQVRGPAIALALTLSGRSALATKLEGPGASQLISAMTKR